MCVPISVLHLFTATVPVEQCPKMNSVVLLLCKLKQRTWGLPWHAYEGDSLQRWASVVLQTSPISFLHQAQQQSASGQTACLTFTPHSENVCFWHHFKRQGMTDTPQRLWESVLLLLHIGSFELWVSEKITEPQCMLKQIWAKFDLSISLIGLP